MSRCIYCGCGANSKDHFVPYSYLRSGKRKGKQYSVGGKENIVSSCMECNMTAGGKVFDTIEEKREHIQERYRQKYKNVLELPPWKPEEINDLGRAMKIRVLTLQACKTWTIARINYPHIDFEILEPPKNTLKKLIKILSE